MVNGEPRVLDERLSSEIPASRRIAQLVVVPVERAGLCVMDDFAGSSSGRPGAWQQRQATVRKSTIGLLVASTNFSSCFRHR